MTAPNPNTASQQWLRLGLAVVTFAVLVTGCGGANSGGSAVSARTSPTSPPPTGKVATVGQYASIVAASDRDFRRSAREVERCYLAGGSAVRSAACKNYALAALLRAFTLSASLKSAPQRIGAPPTEIAELVATTRAAAKVAADGANIKGAHVEKGFETMAVNNRLLIDKLDAWKPYGG